MIYLDNTTQSQQVYIPRQVIQTATTREINNITSGDVINIVDEKLEPYYTSAETDTQIENAVAAESARCEDTYAKIEDIPDVSNLVTNEEFDETIEGIGSQISALTDDFDSFSNTINELSGTVIELQQSISGFASEEYVDNAVGGAIDYVDDQFSSYSQEFTGYLAEKQDITAMTAYYTSAETDTAIENAIAAEVERADSTYATPSDIPDVSEFVTTGDLASYALSADVDTLVEDTIAAESARCEETYAKPDDVSSAVNELTLGLAYLGVVNDVSESNGTVTITKTGLVSGEITTGLTDSFNLPDVSNFVTSGDVETQIDGKGYALSGDLQTLSGNVAQNAEDIYAVDNALYTEFWNSAKTSSEIDKAIDNAIRTESGRTEHTYAKLTDIPDVSNFVTSADVETQIDGNLSAYTPTSNFATINGSGITNGGNIVIQGGGGGVDSGLTERVDEIEEVTSRALNDLNSRFSGYTSTSDLNTRLSAYTPTSGFATINGSGITNGGNLVIQGGGASYSAGTNIDITDNVISVTGIDVSNYVTSADLATKVDKTNVTANSQVRKFTKWNSDGAINGTVGNNVYNHTIYINNSNLVTVLSESSGYSRIIGPTTWGASGQVLQSNGTDNAPTWSSFKIWVGSQNDYDAITNKDSNTIYFVQ